MCVGVYVCICICVGVAFMCVDMCGVCRLLCVYVYSCGVCMYV